MHMNRKNILIASLVTIAVTTSAYVFSPVETPSEQVTADSATKSAKLLDRMVESTPQFASTTIDTRTVINGIKVPPVPDAKINNATVAGVDSDNSGIRDDIDRLIAEKVGNDPLRHQALIRYERSLQLLIQSPSNKTYLMANNDELECFTNDMLDISSQITRVLLNTKERAHGYATALAGTGRGVCRGPVVK
jgi:hypothetical protein